MGKSSQNCSLILDCIFGGLNPLWGWMADVWLCGVLQSVEVDRWQWSDRGIVGAACAVIHMCVYLGLRQRSLAHGEPRAAGSSANSDKQSKHVDIF